MTPLNTIIEEEIIKEFDEMPFGVTIPFNEKMMWGEVEGFQADGREEFKEWLRGKLTTAMQRAYDAGREERDTYWKERVRKIVDIVKYDSCVYQGPYAEHRARGGDELRKILLQSITNEDNLN